MTLPYFLKLGKSIWNIFDKYSSALELQTHWKLKLYRKYLGLQQRKNCEVCWVYLSIIGIIYRISQHWFYLFLILLDRESQIWFHGIQMLSGIWGRNWRNELTNALVYYRKRSIRRDRSFKEVRHLDIWCIDWGHLWS